ncbi:MAG: hypothetical protein C5B50_29105 [Verrucomicrobia bacterium]|nr:MAG: hypothetical protein C5B50_29105 [Verrucomicrobiota bacterium]
MFRPLKVAARRREPPLALILILFASFVVLGQGGTVYAVEALTNNAYRISLAANNSLAITGPGGATQVFQPKFKVLYVPKNPLLRTVRGPETCLMYVPQWTTPDGRTVNYYQAAPSTEISAPAVRISEDTIVWNFAPQTNFDLHVEVSLPGKADEPRIQVTLRALETGCFSVGYVGAPAVPPESLKELWQPPIWQEKRFPVAPVLSMEHMCSLPAVLIRTGATTVGLVADPDFLPFRLPTLTNAHCGVLLRTETGEARPTFFAPVLGEAEAEVAAGGSFTASFRLIVRNGTIYESRRHLARDLFNVRDCRENHSCSLNVTIENMIEFALDDKMAGWNPDLRGCDYSTDVANTVKVVSALHPMSLAMITDRREIFERRALPMIEYLLSREKFLFTTDTNQTTQGASARMLGPTAEVFEWSSLFHFSQDRSTILLQTALERFGNRRALNQNVLEADGQWVDELAMFRLTGQGSYLQAARHLADAYIRGQIAIPRTNFPGHAEFWTDFTPRWMQLLELYEECGEKRFLDAAISGAREHAAFCWMSPKVPAGNVALDMTIYKPGSQLVPGWRVAQIGLMPEAANTYMDNAAVFLAPFAPYFLRIAALSGDDFFRDLARNAIVGRYANYPGYGINFEFSTAYEAADYPTTPPPRNFRYNRFYFNHVWPHIALLLDYLVSDAATRSGGMINFPSSYAQGYVYLQSKVYGDRPGAFYGDRNVWLYMPRASVTTDNVQINSIAARGNGNFYIALMNQSSNAIQTTVRIGAPDSVGRDSTIHLPGIDARTSYHARVWQQNQSASPTTLQDGKLTVPVAGHGITAIAIDGLSPVPDFQTDVLDKTIRATASSSHLVFTNSSLGQINAMILTFGRGLSSAYIWLSADAAVMSQAKLIYRLPGHNWSEQVDASFPFEFRVPLSDNEPQFEFRIEGKFRSNGRVVSTTTQTLKR